MARTLPTAADIREYHKSLSNWGRWGKDDQMGAMNLITPEKRLQAASLIKRGIPVTMGRPIVAEPTPDSPIPPTLHMIESGEGWNTTPGKKDQATHNASEYIGFVYHGYVMTHVDALSHWFDGDKMYNGHPADAVRTRGGATMESIDLLKDGVVTRGVLFDFPTIKGVPYMKPGEAIFPEDLDEAEKRLNVKVEPGDLILIRTGNWERRQAEGPVHPSEGGGASGLHASCLPWLRERDIAMLGGDLAQDVIPSGYDEFSLPVHQVILTAMGCWILDNCNFEDVARMCKQENRYEFFVSVAPLRMANGTGAPVNPIAIF
jgi:kynurenine formamidase